MLSPGPLFLFRCLSDSMVCPIRALFVWADTRVGEEEDDTSVQRILLKVSWRDDISKLDKIWALAESCSEGRAAVDFVEL